MEIVKVRIRTDGIKYLIVPKKSQIEAGEYVMITNDLDLVKKLEKEGKYGK